LFSFDCLLVFFIFIFLAFFVFDFSRFFLAFLVFCFFSFFCFPFFSLFSRFLVFLLRLRFLVVALLAFPFLMCSFHFYHLLSITDRNLEKGPLKNDQPRGPSSIQCRNTSTGKRWPSLTL